MAHIWKSSGEKRTIQWHYEPTTETLQYLTDMQDATKYALRLAYRMTLRENMRIKSPIDLRRELKEWFCYRYRYARHHINPVCKTAVAMLRAYRKSNHVLRIPVIKRLVMRIDSELFKLCGDKIRITIEPGKYAWIEINNKNKLYQDYARNRCSELLLTDRKVCLTFIVSEEEKPLGNVFLGMDLNFQTLDYTKFRNIDTMSDSFEVKTDVVREIMHIQNNFSRRRQRLQKHIRNPAKRIKKLRETRNRQRNRVIDRLHKLSTDIVRKNPNTTFVFENLTGIKKQNAVSTKKFRIYLNRWPYRLYQKFVEYKSRSMTIYINPRGTSSECPVCGGKIEHPAWNISRCTTCDVDYDRNRLASLAILCRGLHLCGQPLVVSAYASFESLKSEYLYASKRPDITGASGTETQNATRENIPLCS